jgi:hypothetical protein
MSAISDFSGLPYHKIYGWFPDKNSPFLYKDDDVICARSETVKGKQRVQKPKKEKNDKKDKNPLIGFSKPPTKASEHRSVANEFDDFFKNIPDERN